MEKDKGIAGGGGFSSIRVSANETSEVSLSHWPVAKPLPPRPIETACTTKYVSRCQKYWPRALALSNFPLCHNETNSCAADYFYFHKPPHDPTINRNNDFC